MQGKILIERENIQQNGGDKMSESFIFWTHGVDVQVEYTDPGRGLNIRRAGWGSAIKQKKGTSNWFHFAIPSATKLNNNNVDYYHAWLRGYINNDAVIDRVHVRETRLGKDCPAVYDSTPINLTGRELNEDFDIPDIQCKGPLALCVHVKFEGENGEVIFTGAGGRFEKVP